MNVVVPTFRIWVVAGLCAVFTAIALLALFRAPMVPATGTTSRPRPVATQLELASSEDALLKEEAALHDPTPLFLPTQWNAADDALAMNAPREPGGSFQSYPAKLTFPEAELKIELPPPVELPTKTAEVFALDKPDRPFVGFGQKDSVLSPLPLRGGFVEVAGAGDGELKLTQALTEDRPPTGEGNWQPLEFMVAIDTTGIVRPPVLTESSRVPGVDSFFEDYLIRVLHIGERLGPGMYRVSIGP
ncbi:MAG: hypothetical protein ABIZ04_24715 [Opitutus sp.]